LYEVLRVSDSRIVVALGDVSGKGIPAALFMAVAVTVLRTLARQISRPDEILRRLNDELVIQNPRGMFVTLQCLIIDVDKRAITCASAGHHALAILSPGRPPRRACPASVPPAGLLPCDDIELETMTFEPGDTFVLFSDGVTEAMNREEQFYGEQRLLLVLAKCDGAAPRDVVQRILADVRSFTNGAKQSDDITVLAARYSA
jgi:sigma-B regulation protein RsbU (phosphoserine phosphatase)